MPDTLSMLDNIANLIAALQVGVLIAISTGILIYYARHRSMIHIALVSLSYIILTMLVAGGDNI